MEIFRWIFRASRGIEGNKWDFDSESQIVRGTTSFYGRDYAVSLDLKDSIFSLIDQKTKLWYPFSDKLTVFCVKSLLRICCPFLWKHAISPIPRFWEPTDEEFRRLKQGTGHAGKWLAECLLIYCAVQFGKEKAGKRDDSGEICWKFVFCGWHVEIEHWSGMDLWIKIRSKQIDFDAGFSFDTRAVIDCALEAQKEEEEKCPCARCVNKIKPFLSCEFSECDLLHHEGCELGPYARALSKFAKTDMFSRKEAINEFHRQFESEEHMRHYVRLTTALSKS